MKLGFGKVNKHAVIPVGDTGVMALVTPVPLELQTGERLDLKTGLVVQVPEGYILSIQSSPSILVHKGLEVLGPTFVSSGDEEELKIPLLNVGKSQINLHPGAQVAVAILHIIEVVEVEEFIPQKQKAVRPKAKSPKGDPFKFEVR